MRACCSHYLTSMRSYDGDEASYIYFLNVLSLFLKVRTSCWLLIVENKFLSLKNNYSLLQPTPHGEETFQNYMTFSPFWWLSNLFLCFFGFCLLPLFKAIQET